MTTRCTAPVPTFGPVAPSKLTLRGIRLFAPGDDEGAGGGSGGDGGGNSGAGDQGGSGSSSDSGGDRGQGNGDRGGSSSGGSNGQGGSGRSNPPEPETFSREYVQELRTEAATRRRSETAATKRAEDAERERDALRGQVAEGRRRDTIRTLAKDAGGNADLLLDSERFRTATSSVDLDKADDVKAAIKTFVDENPSYRVASPGSSGSGRHGGGSDSRPDHSNDLAGAIGAALQPH